MTDTQIPREAVDAAARALGNHINVDFDLLNATDQLAARETALAALNAAAPLLADTEVRNEMLAEIECLRANLAKTRKALFAVEYIANDDWGGRGGGSDLLSWDADEIAQIADAGGRDIEHTSTCATSKAPTEKPGPCDCQTEAGA